MGGLFINYNQKQLLFKQQKPAIVAGFATGSSQIISNHPKLAVQSLHNTKVLLIYDNDCHKLELHF
jgi:hypothetical protein